MRGVRSWRVGWCFGIMRGDAAVRARPGSRCRRAPPAHHSAGRKGVTELLKKILSIAVTILALGALLIYAWHNRELFAGLLDVDVGSLVCLAALWMVLMVLAGRRTQLFLTLFDVDLPVRACVGLEIARTMTAYLVPLKGGQAMKALYLKKREGLSYTRFVTVLLASYPLEILAVAGTGTALALPMALGSGVFDLGVLAGFLGLTIITTVVLKVPLSIPASGNRFVEVLRRAVDGWKLLKEKSASLRQIVMLFVASCVAHGAQLFVAYRALSVDVGLLPALLVGALYTLTFITSVTPATAGLAEAAVGFGSRLIGISFGEGVVAAVLVRAVNTVMTFLLGLAFTYVLSREGREPVGDVGT